LGIPQFVKGQQVGQVDAGHPMPCCFRHGCILTQVSAKINTNVRIYFRKFFISD
jgi:hypothetical protein